MFRLVLNWYKIIRLDYMVKYSKNLSKLQTKWHTTMKLFLGPLWTSKRSKSVKNGHSNLETSTKIKKKEDFRFPAAGRKKAPIFRWIPFSLNSDNRLTGSPPSHSSPY